MDFILPEYSNDAFLKSQMSRRTAINNRCVVSNANGIVPENKYNSEQMRQIGLMTMGIYAQTKQKSEE